MSLVVLTIIMAFGVVLTLGYAAINYFTVKRLDEGNERMRQIAAPFAWVLLLLSTTSIVWLRRFLPSLPSYLESSSLGRWPSHLLLEPS